MKIGLMFGDAPGAQSANDTVDAIVQVEKDGFDQVWFGQIFGSDVMTLIAMAGPRTSRIEFGTAVVPTYPRHPFVMAQQALTVQSAPNNRFTLGIGLSHQPVIEGMWGMSYNKPAKHMREYLSVLMPLVTDFKVGFQGEQYRTTGALTIPGAKPLPVMIAALAPVMLKLAGERTDGTILWMTGLAAIQKHIAPKLQAAASGAGRPSPRIACGLPVIGVAAGAVPELVDADTGVLARPRDAASLAEAVAALCERDLAAMGRAARDRVERLYSWDRVFHRQLLLYQRLLAARRLTTDAVRACG